MHGIGDEHGAGESGAPRPETDLLERFRAASGEREGFSAVYTNAEGKKVPVSWAHHYEFRDVRLRNFNAVEFRRMFSVRKMTKKDREWWGVWKFVEHWARVPGGAAEAGGEEGDGAAAEGEVLLPGEERRLRGRPCERYVLHAPHPLSDSHIIVANAKWDTLVLAGAPPPKLPPPVVVGAELTSAQERAQRDFAKYFVANYTPWDKNNPPELLMARWEEWVLGLEVDACLGGAREDDGLPVDEEGEARRDAQRRERRIAAGRLFDLRNVIDAFRVNKDVAVVLAKHRERMRTLWKADGSNKPAGGGEDEPSDEDWQAAAALKKMREKAARLRSSKDVTTRLNEAQAAKKTADKLRSQLPSAAAGARARGAAGSGLCSLWPAAAQPARRTIDGVARDVRRVSKALTRPLPAREVAARDASTVAAAARANASRAEARAAAAARGDPMPAAGPFDQVSDREYEGLVAERTVRVDAGLEVGRPPLNPEQRDGGRDFLRHAMLRAELLARGQRQQDVTREVRAAGIPPITAVFGPGGTGKSAMVHELEQQMTASRSGALIVTAYTGVAAAPFGGPTLLSLLNLSIESKSAKHVRQLSQQQQEAAREKFFQECGVRIEDVGGMVVDEVSFLEDALFGHIDSRLQQLTGCIGVLCGGIPLLLCGDNHQKPPPAGTPWYKALVADALEGGATAAEGTKSAKARGLDLLRAARKVELKRLMRAAGDEPFIEVQRRMRRTDVAQPVDPDFLKKLRTVTAADIAADESWRFTPVGVLSHLERDTINVAQLEAFARAFDLPLVKWRLEMEDEIGNAELRDELYAEESSLWGWFVEGAPVNLTETIKAVRKLANGSPALLDSLEFRDGAVPSELAAALARGGFEVVELAAPPFAVNVHVGGVQSPPGSAPGSTPGSVLWHGIELDDLSGLIDSDYASGVQVCRGPEVMW